MSEKEWNDPDEAYTHLLFEEEEPPQESDFLLKLRTWALRLCIYGVVCELALIILFLRYIAEGLNAVAVSERATYIYIVSVLCFFGAILVSAMADRKGVPDRYYKLTVYIVSGVLLLVKGINAITQSGVYWIYQQNDMRAGWPS